MTPALVRCLNGPMGRVTAFDVGVTTRRSEETSPSVVA
jgi:hypothetical protein